MHSFICKFFLVLMLGLGTTAYGQAEIPNQEQIAALKGSLAERICQIARKQHQKNLKWPSADTMAYYSGLRGINREYNTDFAIHVLAEPHDPMPEELEKTQTFVVYFFYSPVDSSRYVQCSIYYEDGSGPYTISSGDGEAASIWSIQMDVQTALLKFLEELSQNTSEANLDSLSAKYADELSFNSPKNDLRAKQLLFELCYEVLLDVSVIVPELDPDSQAYKIELDGYSELLADYIFHQNWKRP